MAITDRTGLPIAIHLATASAHEVTLVEETLETCFVSDRPRCLIGDRAYDSDPLDEKLRTLGIDLIAPHKSNRVKTATQDGRKLRRYSRRWKVERFFAWLQNYRRVLVRQDYLAEIFLGFIQLAVLKMLINSYL